jgi:hypothetical protein
LKITHTDKEDLQHWSGSNLNAMTNKTDAKGQIKIYLSGISYDDVKRNEI